MGKRDLLPLANKYRPTTFSEVVGQDAVVKELKGLVENKTYEYINSIIISGGSGAGKTTLSRILAKAINCKSDGERPCNKCDVCKSIDAGNYPDYKELDASTYRGVKEIEPLRELATLNPVVEGGVRIIYLDEAHVLSNQAWDTLLKPLEDGKNSTLWIFATTQLYSIRPAIVGRSLVFKVKNVPQNVLKDHLKTICKKEGIKAPESLLDTIVRVKRHGLRDVITELDKYYKAYGKDLTKVETFDITSPEEELVDIFLTLSDVGYVDAVIKLESLDLHPKEFQRVVSNILIAEALLNTEEEKYITNFGLSVESVKKLSSNFTDLVKLRRLVVNYDLDTLDNLKLFLLVLADFIKKEEVVNKADALMGDVEEVKTFKVRKGVKTVKPPVVKYKTEETKPKVKKKKKSKKSKKDKLLDLGFEPVE